MNKRTVMKRYVIVLLFVLGIYAHAGITINKAKLKEKVSPNNEVTSGYADADLSVDFVSDAECDCCCPQLEYQWCFGDGDTAYGKNVSHTYGSDGAGNNTAHVHVTCKTSLGGCGTTATSGSLSVYAIDDIRVDTIGDVSNPANDGRLCFNSVLNIGGTALPDGVNGSDKIDWSVLVGTKDVDKANTSSGSLPNLADADWPTSNSSWGSGTLYISIDGPHVAGQEGELRLTGTVSFVTNPKSVKKFFDGGDSDSQNASSNPNWYYYYTDALSNGPHTYNASVNWGVTHYSTQPVYIEIGANANDSSPRFANCDYINNFANIVQHEKWHKLHREHNYASHGSDGKVASPYDGDGDHVCDGGCGTGGWEATYGTDPALYATFGGVVDREYIARQQETNTNHSNIDWAHPGNQW